MKNALERLNTLPTWKKTILKTIGVVVGIILGGFLVFQVFFLSKVIPHGGLW